MRAGDEFERLRAAINELAAGDAAEILLDARAEARARVRTLLTDALADSLLQRVRERLDGGPDARVAPTSRPRSSASDHAPAAEPRPSGDSAWYVYGIVSAAEAQLPELAGINPASSVTAVAEGELAALVSLVGAEEFGEEQLRRHLGDLGWVEATARAHERVLDAVRERVTVVPMRMCTVYGTEDGVRDMLRREAEALSDALGRLRGKTEWSVKAIYDRDSARLRPAERDVHGGAAASGAEGAAYMQSRRRERDREESVPARVDAACARIHERLCALAADGVLAPPQRGEATGRRGEMVLNGAYLVEDALENAFHEEVETLHAAYAVLGLELQTTGPWPAYNFVPGTLGAAW